MNNKRVQVDIKANHKPVVQKLMKKLGGVSAADAIGFLIETQINAALARLDPMTEVSQSVTKSVQFIPPSYEPVSNPPPQRQQPTQQSKQSNSEVFSHQNKAPARGAIP